MRWVIESLLLALCAGIAAVGYGSGLGRVLRIRPNLGDRGIMGLLVIGSLGCILHFVIALSTPAQIMVLSGGVLLSGILWREIQTEAALSFVAATGLYIFVLLHWQDYRYPDDGIYHLQTFKWNYEFPVTIGLGNLHGRLAFNSLLFLIGPLTDRIEIGWIANFLAVAFVLMSLWARLRRPDLSRRSIRVQFWFVTFVFAVFVLRPTYLMWIGIMVGDSFVAVLVVYWLALAMGFSASSDRRTQFALLMLSSVLIMTVKISGAPLLALAMGLGWFHRKEGVLGAVPVLALGSAVLTVWMLRGLLLSGCAVYPVRQTCVSGLQWAMPFEQVRNEELMVKSWARSPGEHDFARVLRDWSWFPQWARVAGRDPLIELLLVGFLLGILAVLTAGSRIHIPPRDDLVFIGTGLAASLGFWFLSAPAIRFGSGLIFASAMFGLSLAGAGWLHRPRFYTYAPQVLILFMVIYGLHGLMRLSVGTYFSAIPDAAVYQVRSPQGIGLWVPPSGLCWAHELPCTPSVDPAALPRVHWPEAWPYRYDSRTEPPKGWMPPSGVDPWSH